MLKRFVLVGVAVASVVALSACGSSSPGGSPSDSGASVKVTVGTVPIPDLAALYLGDQKGFFSDEGLDLTLSPTTGGAAAVPGLIAGSYDFAVVNYVSDMVAVDKGLAIQVVAPVSAGNGATLDGHAGFQAVIVRSDSPIKSPKDLAGKTVAVNNLANINDTTVRGVVEADGGDQSLIKFVEIAFPDAVAAVTNKQVDAATVSPYVPSMASGGEYRVVMYNISAFDPKLDVASLASSTAFIKDHPDVVKKFKAALVKSAAYATAHPDEARQIMTTYTKLSADVLKELVLPVYPKDFNRASLTKLGAAAFKYGTLSKAPNLDELLAK